MSLVITDEPPIPEKLLLLVDIANIRPRGDGQIRRFLNSFKRRPYGSDELTTLEFIDRCVTDLEKEAPGAVIVKFSDRALYESLPLEEREEFFRRSELSFAEPEKIVVISTVQADKPLIKAANALQASIISQDNFDQRDLREMMTNEISFFKFHFDVNKDCFTFQQKNGKRLSDWWAENVGQFSDAWYQSDERLNLEYRLRSEVRDLTFEFHSEPLTFTPEVPARALEELDRMAREREMQRELLTKSRPKVHAFSEPERTIFADEFSVLDQNVGRVILLIGRLGANEDSQWVEWFPSFRPITIVGPRIPDVYGKDRFVAVTGRLETDGVVLALHLDPDRHFGYRMFNDVVSARPIYLISEDPVEPQRLQPWSLPSFSNALKMLRTIRSKALRPNQSITLEPVEDAPAGRPESRVPVTSPQGSDVVEETAEFQSVKKEAEFVDQPDRVSEDPQTFNPVVVSVNPAEELVTAPKPSGSLSVDQELPKVGTEETGESEMTRPSRAAKKFGTWKMATALIALVALSIAALFLR